MKSWRQEAAEELARLAAALERGVRRSVGRVEGLVDRDEFVPCGYRSYGTRERVLVLGRVLQVDATRPMDGTSKRANLIAALRRIESDPLPYAKVTVSPGDAFGDTREITADDEGFLREWVGVREPLPEGGWHPVHLALKSGASTVCQTLIPPVGAAFGVISDMDDTVLQSNVASFLRAARLVLLENAQTRMPFPGVAAFYRALERGTALTGPNPIFYVSKSPWNLYDVIATFLEKQEIPLGPVLLRDWDLVQERQTKDFKTREIESIFQAYPQLPFLLIGDTTQKDPEIYRSIVRAFPGRVKAVYIRNVKASTGRSEAVKKLGEEVMAEGATLILADDTMAMAKHAVEQGWIEQSSLETIAGDKRADEGVSGDKAPAPQTPAGKAPTVIMEG